MGPKASQMLVNALRTGKNIYGAAAMKSASKLLRGNVVTAAASVVVLSSVDIINIFRGRISAAQLFKNITNTTSFLKILQILRPRLQAVRQVGSEVLLPARHLVL